VREDHASVPNAVLRQCADCLSRISDVRVFIGEVLVALVERAGGRSGAVCRYEPASSALVLEAAVLHGELVDVRGDERRDAWCAALRVAAVPELPTLTHPEDDPHVHRIDFTDPRLPEQCVAWHRAEGHATGAAVTLRRGEAVIGFLGLAYRAGVEVNAGRLRSARTLMRELMLALEVARLTDASLADERNRLARDIHDTLAQALAQIIMQLTDAEDKLGPAWATAREPLDTVRRLAVNSLAEARRSVAMLRPSATAFNLTRAVHDATDLVRRYYRGQLGVRVTGAPRLLDPAVEAELFGIVREALTNAARHSQGGRIDVELAFLGERGVRLVVADDGQGFDPNEPHTEHYGLVGMYERAERIGAALTLVTEPGAGTEIVAVWPA
jgi:signal transduction histidine kinase